MARAMNTVVELPGDLPAATLYSRGFFYGPRTIELLEELDHFRTIRLPGATLQHDEVTEVDVAYMGDDFVAVVGKTFALSTGALTPKSTAPAQELLDLAARDGLDAVERALYDLAGRYAVIIRVGGQTYVYNDAAATRTVYFDAKRGHVSSHFDILERVGDPEAVHPTYSKTVALTFWWDQTLNTDIRALIANHRLHLEDGHLTRFHLIAENPFKDLSHEERMQLVEDLWDEQIQWMISLNKPLAMSVTGGRDSRFTLAMAGEHKDHFQSLTYTTASAIRGEEPTSRWASVMQTDHDVVEKLRPFIPKAHAFVVHAERNAWGKANIATLERNTTDRHGRWILPGYLSLFPRRDSIHYRGNLLEIGRYYLGRLDVHQSDVASVHRVVQSGVAKQPDEVKEEAAYRADQGMETLEYAAVHEDYPWVDVFYWENRHSRWYGPVLNETDIVFDTISPFNVRRIIELFLSYDVKDRKGAFLQMELIYRKNPFLLFYAINENTDLYRQHVSAGIPRIT